MAYKDFTEMPAQLNKIKDFNFAEQNYFTGPVWKMAFQLLKQVYKCTKNYPTEEKYGLISDMRRASNSVTNNIAEGFGRPARRRLVRKT